MIDNQRCLLVVDDEEDFRILFRNHFRKRDYAVLEAGDGIEALEVFADHSREIDLVVTDIRMPRMNGEELIRELRRRRRYLPIVGITGQADLQDKLAMLDKGAYYYLEKPVPHWAIVERLVENAVRLHQYEEKVELSRAKEREIARLVRTYILKGPIQPNRGPDPNPDRRFRLDVAVEPIEIAAPGGDFVEWFERDGNEVVFYVADVSGHGDLVPCFIACLSSIVLHRCHHGGMQPGVGEITTFVDQALDELRLAGALDGARYLTLFVGCIHLATGAMTYVNAGHPDGFLARSAGVGGGEPAVHRLKSTGCPAGHFSLVNQNQEIEVGQTQLRDGDLLFLYTDGASEMLEFGGGTGAGINRLEAAVRPLAGEPARAVVDQVAAHLRRQLGPEGFRDDTTLMAIRILTDR